MIKLSGIGKEYDLGETRVQALKNIHLSIYEGEYITIMGPSGSGKSTLLHILGTLDLPSSGTYRLKGIDIRELDDRELSRIRAVHFGFVFQSFNLLPEYNALENVMLPMMYANTPKGKRKDKAVELLCKVGMEHRIYHYPDMLSGGEQQRTAIARALANDPTFILADEPTGNLPRDKGKEVLELLRKLNADGVTLIIVTHDEELGKTAPRRVHMEDGVLHEND